MKPNAPTDLDVSCIIPVYNTADYIEQCLNSIVAQDSVNIEIICIDDASSDDSAYKIGRLIEKHPNIIKLIRNETNKGVSYSRNMGIKQSTGKYISFIDSDDWIGPDFFSQILKDMQESQSQIGTSNIHRYNNKSREITKVFSKWQRAGFASADYFTPSAQPEKLLEMNPCIWDGLFCRSLFTNNKISFPELPFAEDLYCFFELFLKAQKVCHSESSIYFYRVKRAGSVISDRSIDYVSPLIQALDYIVNLLSKTISKEDFERMSSKALPEFIIENLHSSYKRLQKKRKKSCYISIQNFIESLPNSLKKNIKKLHSHNFYQGSWLRHNCVTFLNKRLKL